MGMCYVTCFGMFFSYRHRHRPSHTSPSPLQLNLMDEFDCDSTREKIAHSCYNCCWLRPPNEEKLRYSSAVLFSSLLYWFVTIRHTNSLTHSHTHRSVP